MYKRHDILHILFISILIFGALLMLFPYIWMLITSLKSNAEILSNKFHFFPQNITFAGYKKVLTEAPFFWWFLNSLIVALVVSGFVLFTSSIAGYIFAKMDFKGKNIFFLIILSTLMLPPQVMLVPRFFIIINLQLKNNLLALILPAIVTGFGIYLCRQFISNLPTSVLEAAKIDGAGNFLIFRKIILPQIMPGLSALFIFTFMASWNDYLSPLIYMDSPRKMTLPLALVFFNGKNVINYNVVMSVAVLIMLPVIIVFLIFQRNFIKGMSMSGLK